MSDEFDPMLSLPEPFGRSPPVIDPALVDDLKRWADIAESDAPIGRMLGYFNRDQLAEILRNTVAALEGK